MHAERGEICAEAADAVEACRAGGGTGGGGGHDALRLIETAAAESGRVRAGRGRPRCSLKPGFRFQSRRSAADQFPPAALDVVYAGLRFCGNRPHEGRLRARLASGYRFYSYGDACLLERTEAG